MKARRKFYVGKVLAVDHTWNLSENFMDEITDDAESMIEEAIQANATVYANKRHPLMEAAREIDKRRARKAKP